MSGVDLSRFVGEGGIRTVGDNNLIPDNIKDGVTILGVEGAFLTYYGVAEGTAPSIEIDTSKNYKVACIYDGGGGYATFSKIESGTLSRVATINGDTYCEPTLSGTTLTLGRGNSSSAPCYNVVMEV